MLDEKKNIDQLFQNKLADHGKDLPNFVWDNIEDSLDRKKRRKLIFWYRNIAASILLILAFGTGYHLATQNQNQQAELVRNETENLTPLNQTEKQFPKNHKIAATDTPTEIDQSKAKTTNRIATKKTTIHNFSYNHKKEIIEDDHDIVSTSNKINRSNSIISNTKQQIILTDTISSSEIDLISTLKQDTLVQDKKDNPIQGILENEKTTLAENNPEETKNTLDSILPIMPKEELLAMNENSNTGYRKWYLGGNINGNISNNSFDNTKSYGEAYSPQTTMNYSAVNTLSDTPESSDNTEEETSPELYESLVQNTIAEDLEDSPVSFSFGLQAVHMLNTQTGVQFGGYYQKRFSLLSDGTKTRLSYLEIPIALRYKFLDKKVSMSLVSGIGSAFLLGNKLESPYFPTTKLKQTNPVVLSGLLGVSFQSKFFKQWFISMEPTIKYRINNITKKYNGDRKPFSYGFYMGIGYEF